MFFDGDLQAGIALALKDKKPIVCFVKDDGETSLYWQDDFLKDHEIATKLATDAVALCIQAESQEAQYLSAYFPVSVVPTLIIISNGQLILELKSEASKIDFKNGILTALQSPPYPGTSEAAGSSDFVYPHRQPAEANSSSSNHHMDTPSGADTEPDMTPPTITSSTVRDLLRDRQQRIEAEMREVDAAKRDEQKATAKAQREAIENTPSSAKAEQASYAEHQRKRQQAEKLERERIRRDIQYDKAFRKEKEELRRPLHNADKKSIDGAGGLVDQQLSSDARRASQKSSNRFALQIRLFDGSTIRKTFQPHETLQTDVRPWIDEQGARRDEPYTFKHIVTPMPNRTIGISEEEESLFSLGLMPSATLVMVPVSKFTEAYNQGTLSRGISTGYQIASLGVSMVTGALHRVLGFGQATQQAGEPISQSQTKEPARARSDIRIRSLHDQQDEPHEHQLYNGNQLNFEPRRDNEDAQD